MIHSQIEDENIRSYSPHIQRRADTVLSGSGKTSNRHSGRHSIFPLPSMAHLGCHHTNSAQQKKQKNGRETVAITRRHSAIEQPHVSRPKNTFFPNTLALTAKQVGTEHPRPPPPHQLLGAQQPAVFRLILDHRRISPSSRRQIQ